MKDQGIIDVKHHKGGMHEALGVPKDKQISDVYKSPKKAAEALIKKLGRQKASGMINWAANIKGGKDNFMDEMQKALKSIKEESTNPSNLSFASAIDSITKDVASGKSVKEIADSYGVSESLISAMVKQIKSNKAKLREESVEDKGTVVFGIAKVGSNQSKFDNRKYSKIAHFLSDHDYEYTSYNDDSMWFISVDYNGVGELDYLSQLEDYADSFEYTESETITEESLINETYNVNVGIDKNRDDFSSLYILITRYLDKNGIQYNEEGSDENTQNINIGVSTREECDQLADVMENVFAVDFVETESFGEDIEIIDDVTEEEYEIMDDQLSNGWYFEKVIENPNGDEYLFLDKDEYDVTVQFLDDGSIYWDGHNADSYTQQDIDTVEQYIRERFKTEQLPIVKESKSREESSSQNNIEYFAILLDNGKFAISNSTKTPIWYTSIERADQANRNFHGKVVKVKTKPDGYAYNGKLVTDVEDNKDKIENFITSMGKTIEEATETDKINEALGKFTVLDFKKIKSELNDLKKYGTFDVCSVVPYGDSYAVRFRKDTKEGKPDQEWIIFNQGNSFTFKQTYDSKNVDKVIAKGKTVDQIISTAYQTFR